MSIQGMGNPNQVNTSSAAISANRAETASAAKDTAKAMADVMSDIKTIDEGESASFISGKKVTKGKDEGKLESQANKVLDQLQEQSKAESKQVQSQQQNQQTEMSKGKGAEQVAAAKAGMEEEEEIGNTKAQKELDEKMEILLEHAEKLGDIELENSDDNFELQQMFQNMSKMKDLKRKDKNLSKQIEDLEIRLKEQDAQEELNNIPLDESTLKMKEQLLYQSEVNPHTEIEEIEVNKDTEEIKEESNQKESREDQGDQNSDSEGDQNSDSEGDQKNLEDE